MGYLKREFAALGVDFDERAAVFEESLRVIRAIWTGDDLDFDGAHFTAKGITAHPRPISVPHPPIWIGGNTSAARARVAAYGQGWCPFRAPALLAQTARTAALDSAELLVAGIEDLHRRLEMADRDPAEVDITFTNAAGGNPGNSDFDAEEFAAGVAELEAAGVTWIQVAVPGDSLAHTLEAIEQFGVEVISRR